ncbi:bestrophin [Acinetobacter sp. ANC 4204]|uniref:bestrophin family protein n=1 Tax=unclassified Acinetobacter TaxID=196816 RepID=UPI000A354720|nr:MULTISPECIES: bestrophin family protein [unclassified Acinetobacter]OTG57443.1 bestrophin [Acinetobacter sp. ANC 4204]
MIVRDKTNSFALLFAWRGTILPKVFPALMVGVLISTLLVYLSTQHFVSVPAVPTIGFTVFGVILSIFLSFRNTACYDRWWEGRKLWGALIANSRHIIRDSYVLNDTAREVLMYRVMLFSHLLRDRLRKQSYAFEHYREKTQFKDEEWQVLKNHSNQPQYVLELAQKDLTVLYKEGEISDIIYSGLRQHTVAMGDIHAGCDRISSTPLPFSYSVLLHRAVYSFCVILPFSLSSSLGFWSPVIVALIAYLVLGLDALSAELEEPFGLQENDLALDAIVRGIEREMLSSLKHPLPPEMSPHKANLR